MNCRFKELRIQKGITQEEFRQEFNSRYNRNYTPSAISLFENNKRIPEISALIDFADYFGVSIDYLLQHRTSDTPGEQLSLQVRDHMRKYRELSDGGKEIVDGTLEVVHRQEQFQKESFPSIEKREIS